MAASGQIASPMQYYSMYPKLWEAEGISAAELIDDLLMLAVDEME